MGKFEQSLYRERIRDWCVALLLLEGDSNTPKSLEEETGVPASTIRTWKQKFCEKFNSLEEAEERASYLLYQEGGDSDKAAYVVLHIMYDELTDLVKALEFNLTTNGVLDKKKFEKESRRVREQQLEKAITIIEQPIDDFRTTALKLMEEDTEQDEKQFEETHTYLKSLGELQEDEEFKARWAFMQKRDKERIEKLAAQMRGDTNAEICSVGLP